MRIRSTLPLLLALTALPAATATAAHDPVVTEFAASPEPRDMALGADGDVWFTDDSNPGGLGRIAVDGKATTFTAGLSPKPKPRGITAGPGGAWFVARDTRAIGRITPAGSISQFVVPGGDKTKLEGIAAGADGNLWVTASKLDGNNGDDPAILRLTPGGTLTPFDTGLDDDEPEGITAGPDGALWFTLPEEGRIGRISTTGAITQYGEGVLTGTPRAITAGPDGALWFTQDGLTPAIGRISTTGAITQWSAGLPLDSAPRAITAGPDGALWFTDRGANAIGRIATDGAISTYRAGLSPAAGLHGITAGADGRLWFAESSTGRIGAIAPPAGTAADHVVPAAAAVPVPDAPAAEEVKEEPALGRTAVATVTRGSVRVRLPGSKTAVLVDGDTAIPSGSIIDTRDGTISLESALDAKGRTQTARFRGARFRMELPRKLVGTVDIKLADGATGCKRVGRGKYRTHGRNSVAVVRGTEWTTEETCAGTRTRVVHGKVSVWDRRTGKSVLVRAGHSHLARPKR
jgi:virginiamycin B lyase